MVAFFVATSKNVLSRKCSRRSDLTFSAPALIFMMVVGTLRVAILVFYNNQLVAFLAVFFALAIFVVICLVAPHGVQVINVAWVFSNCLNFYISLSI